MKGERKRKMRELMVDIETMGTDVNAPIIQIGAVYFSLQEGTTGDEFLVNIDLGDAMQHGACPDGYTIYWWLSQSEAARKSLRDPKPLEEYNGLREFNQFAARSTRVWSHATFDFVLLVSAMRRRDIQPTFHYRKARDIRTLTSLGGMTREEVDLYKVERQGIHHNGLDDAIYQVAYCHECFKRLQRKGELT